MTPVNQTIGMVARTIFMLRGRLVPVWEYYFKWANTANAINDELLKEDRGTTYSYRH